MDPKISLHRQRVLSEMARIERMETGSLAEEYRETSGQDGKTQINGPYFKHQVWENGRNRSRRVAPEEARLLREAIEGRQRFESLSSEFIELTVAATREADPRKKNSAKPSKKNAARRRKPS